jgi:hypothetical protein
MRFLPENNLAAPVLIALENGSSASGFFFQNETSTYVVTAKHVLFDKKTNKLWAANAHGIAYTQDLRSQLELRLNLEKLKSDQNIKCHQDADVAIIEIIKDNATVSGAITEGITEENGGFVMLNTDYTTKYDDVLESNEVFIFGYPSSLAKSNQIDRNRPLLRKGIVAGKNHFQKTVIIDCPSYNGNSGGLVIQVNRPHAQQKTSTAIGVVSQAVMFREEFKSVREPNHVNIFLENSGYTVVEPMDRVLELL